ncbi:ATP-binding protein [Sphingomonas sp.]|uniref:AAA family ATPase n=1 Tax=Sphingomonas sp. TaxID=28214 RepID=UPI0025CDEE1B|nr:ATP-binding protein [Sphingomonas sp.]
MRRYARETRAAFLDGDLYINRAERSDPSKFDHVLYDLIDVRLRKGVPVVVDGIRDFMPRPVFGLMMHHFKDVALKRGVPLVMESVDDEAAIQVKIPALLAEDYEAYFAARFGGKAVSGIDFPLVHEAAAGLDLYQLDFLANLMEVEGLTTAQMIACLERDVLKANLRLREVEALSFDSLPGSEHIAEALETHIILPFENKVLARELDLKPRRGVLLYGPPGTGKTSIGRALAHRMQGRFFLIDGSVITEPPSYFFGGVEGIIAQAKKNAPCVLFIDDADVLFQIEHIAGLQRYLLSLLDGLESETASHVCVMMTAMDAKKVPEPLLRSGRVELWLETKAPDEVTRGRILERWMAADMPGREDIDYPALARLTQGFTPADLRRLASDAKLLYASDLVAKRPIADANRYLELAIDDLITLRATMAERLDDATLKVA